MDVLGGKGNVVIIHGPNGHSAEVQRTEGIHEVLTNYPDIKVVAEQTRKLGPRAGVEPDGKLAGFRPED